MSAIAAKVDPALVNIDTTLAQGRAAGTGMLISSTGEILTNNHVIADAKTIKVVVGGNRAVVRREGRRLRRDRGRRAAPDHRQGLEPADDHVGDPNKAQVGDPVVAIGNAGWERRDAERLAGPDHRARPGGHRGRSGGNQETLEGMIQNQRAHPAR